MNSKGDLVNLGFTLFLFLEVKVHYYKKMCKDLHKNRIYRKNK